MNELLSFLKIKTSYSISPMQLFSILYEENNDDICVVDVRNPGKRIITERIRGSIHVPQSQIDERLSELDKKKTIILYAWDDYCSLGYRSAITLLSNGFNDVKEIMGGIEVWSARQLPVDIV